MVHNGRHLLLLGGGNSPVPIPLTFPHFPLLFITCMGTSLFCNLPVGHTPFLYTDFQKGGG
jgi:hypothetical protein